jgi:hypothetical protein
MPNYEGEAYQGRGLVRSLAEKVELGVGTGQIGKEAHQGRSCGISSQIFPRDG